MRYKDELKKIGIALGISLATLLLTTLFISTLYYFNILGNKVFTVIELIVPLLSFLIGGIIVGRNSKSKGWLEGLKLGLILSILFLLISFLGFEIKFEIGNIIYYLIIVIITTFGSMIGINYQKKD